MRDSNFVWRTSDGREIKIIDMETSHLYNTLNHVKTNEWKFNKMYGKIEVDKYISAFNQEIRYRKLNRLNNEDSETLF